MRVLSKLARKGLSRGVFGGSNAWLALGLGAGFLVVARRLLGETPGPPYRTRLEPGEGLVIRLTGPPDTADAPDGPVIGSGPSEGA